MAVIPCAVCGSVNTQPIIQKFGFPIARCQNCGLVYANPRMPVESILARYSPRYFWDEYLPAHHAKDGVFQLEEFDAQYAAALKLIQASAGGPGKLLEIGTGAGFFLKAAQRAGWQVQGVELSAEAAAFARERLGLDIAQLPAERLGELLETFDVVVMFEVIEHLFDPRRVLELIRQRLRPGGVLVLSTPNFNALSRLALGQSWAVLTPGEHLYYFTRDSLQALLQAAGFNAIQFHNNFAAWGTIETMNPRHTHAPHGLRAVLYYYFVVSIGRVSYRWVLAQGRGDTLLCVARA
jgi:SAM-dependent methyltransferase